MSERVWCAMCGQWGDHGSGSCPALRHDGRSNDDLATLVISLILIVAGLAVLVAAAWILATGG